MRSGKQPVLFVSFTNVAALDPLVSKGTWVGGVDTVVVIVVVAGTVPGDGIVVKVFVVVIAVVRPVVDDDVDWARVVALYIWGSFGIVVSNGFAVVVVVVGDVVVVVVVVVVVCCGSILSPLFLLGMC